MTDFKEGEKYKLKSDYNLDFDFPMGKYEIKSIAELFPGYLNSIDDELEISRKHWLEKWDNNEQKYKKIHNGLWFYLQFPDNKYREWIPEYVMEEVFIK